MAETARSAVPLRGSVGARAIGRLRRTNLTIENPYELPAYSLDQAARYVGLPRNTLRDWVRGRSYPLAGGRRGQALRVIVPADPEHARLSFNNLLEAHVLDAIRRQHGVRLRQVRQGIDWLRRKLKSGHPLIDQALLTDGTYLFVHHLVQLINVSKEGQHAMAEVLQRYLKRIERDKHGIAVRFYPFTRPYTHQIDAPRIVTIDPHIAFGRPILSNSSVPTGVIAERYQAGESVEELAEDYGETLANIQEAIRCELQFARAA